MRAISPGRVLNAPLLTSEHRRDIIPLPWQPPRKVEFSGNSGTMGQIQ